MGWIGADFFKRNLPGGRQARIERVELMGTDFWGGPAWRQMGADWIIWDSYKLLLQNFNILVVLKLLL